MEVEAVIMSYDTTGRYQGSSDTDSSLGWGHRRATLCVSSQVGCQMGCTFCATGGRRLVAGGAGLSALGCGALGRMDELLPWLRLAASCLRSL